MTSSSTSYVFEVTLFALFFNLDPYFGGMEGFIGVILMSQDNINNILLVDIFIITDKMVSLGIYSMVLFGWNSDILLAGFRYFRRTDHFSPDPCRFIGGI